MYPTLTQLHTNSQSPSASLLIIYTGGTIGMDYDTSGQFLIPLDFDTLFQKVPELEQFGYQLTLITPFAPLDSADLEAVHWAKLAEVIYQHYTDYDGFVILHGTDTMAYTASALSFMLENLGKPVILTGSQLPMSAPRTDARENLISALEIASAPARGQARVSEVCVFFDSALLRGNRSRKVQSVHFSAFDSPNYPHLGEAGIFMDYNHGYLLPPPSRGLRLHRQCCAHVHVLRLYPGIPEGYARAVLNDAEVRGVVLETFGAGNLPSYPWLWKLLEEASKRGIVIFNVSQCMGGTVLQGHYATSGTLGGLGVVSGRDITPEAAITKLMFLLALEEDPHLIRQQLAQPLCGEMRNDTDYENFMKEISKRNLPSSLVGSDTRQSNIPLIR